MAIWLKLYAIYQAVVAKDWATVFKLIGELLTTTAAATPADHAEVNAMFAHLKTFKKPA